MGPLREDAFHAARRFDIEARRLEGEDVSWRERQLEQWLEWRAAEDAVTHAERVAAVPVEPDVDEMLPEAIKRENEQAIDNRLAMRQALGRPPEEHREWSELLGGRSL